MTQQHHEDAAAALDDIATIERRIHASLFYDGSGDILIAWGIVCVCGYLFSWLHPRNSLYVWLALDGVGLAATLAILTRHIPRARWRVGLVQRVATYAAFIVFGVLMHIEFAPVRFRQDAVFWPTLVLFGYVLLGIWAGWRLAYFAIAVMLLVLIGFFAFGHWLLPWLAVVFGGGLILGGLWIRRMAWRHGR